MFNKAFFIAILSLNSPVKKAFKVVSPIEPIVKYSPIVVDVVVPSRLINSFAAASSIGINSLAPTEIKKFLALLNIQLITLVFIDE